MRLFWKIFTAVFLTLVGAVFIIAYFTTVKQITDAEQHLVEKYTTTGDFSFPGDGTLPGRIQVAV